MTEPTTEEVQEARNRYETGDADALDIIVLLAAEEISSDDVRRYSDEHGWVSI